MKEVVNMVEVKKEEMVKIGHLFQDMHDTVILSCLQGHMGRAWTDNLENPKGALIHVGSFCFLAGDDNSEQVSKLTQHILDLTGMDFAYCIPEKKGLGDLLLMHFGDDCKVIQRYAMKKKQDEFDIEKLKTIVSTLPSEYKLGPIDGELYEKALAEDWSEDFVSNFLSKEDYIERGIGRVITHNGKIISGASSYSIYNEGIEIEISTREDYRKQGLAHIAGAALILACREKGLIPSWDAANLISVQRNWDMNTTGLMILT
jgi:hypothetical protein